MFLQCTCVHVCRHVHSHIKDLVIEWSGAAIMEVKHVSWSKPWHCDAHDQNSGSESHVSVSA